MSTATTLYAEPRAPREVDVAIRGRDTVLIAGQVRKWAGHLLDVESVRASAG